MWLAHTDGWYFLDTWTSQRNFVNDFRKVYWWIPIDSSCQWDLHQPRQASFTIRPESWLNDFAWLLLQSIFGLPGRPMIPKVLRCQSQPGRRLLSCAVGVSVTGSMPGAQCLVSPLPSGGEWWSTGRTDFCNQRSRPFIQAACLQKAVNFRLRHAAAVEGLASGSSHSHSSDGFQADYSQNKFIFVFV